MELSILCTQRRTPSEVGAHRAAVQKMLIAFKMLIVFKMLALAGCTFLTSRSVMYV